MQTITIDGKEIRISEESYEELKKSLLPKDERWVPKSGEKYYYVDSGSDTNRSYLDNDFIDLFRLGQGNVFKAEEEAEKHTKKLQAISDVTNYCWENGLAKKWVKGEEDWKIWWNSKNEKFDFGWGLFSKDATVIPQLKSAVACNQLIKEKEKELKLIFEV